MIMLFENRGLYILASEASSCQSNARFVGYNPRPRELLAVDKPKALGCNIPSAARALPEICVNKGGAGTGCVGNW